MAISLRGVRIGGFKARRERERERKRQARSQAWAWGGLKPPKQKYSPPQTKASTLAILEVH